jgi:hypothetical protein
MTYITVRRRLTESSQHNSQSYLEYGRSHAGHYHGLHPDFGTPDQDKTTQYSLLPEWLTAIYQVDWLDSGIHNVQAQLLKLFSFRWPAASLLRAQLWRQVRQPHTSTRLLSSFYRVPREDPPKTEFQLDLRNRDRLGWKGLRCRHFALPTVYIICHRITLYC